MGGVNLWWGESTGGNFSRWGMSMFLTSGGHPPSRENLGLVDFGKDQIFTFCFFLTQIFLSINKKDINRYK